MRILTAFVADVKTEAVTSWSTGESRLFDTDDVDRMWRGVVAALRALGFRVARAPADDAIVVGRSRPAGRLQELTVRVSPRGESQLIVRAEPLPGTPDIGEPLSYEIFFDLLSQRMYLPAHKT
jgi:hypothetical protein